MWSWDGLELVGKRQFLWQHGCWYYCGSMTQHIRLADCDLQRSFEVAVCWEKIIAKRKVEWLRAIAWLPKKPRRNSFCHERITGAALIYWSVLLILQCWTFYQWCEVSRTASKSVDGTSMTKCHPRRNYTYYYIASWLSQSDVFLLNQSLGNTLTECQLLIQFVFLLSQYLQVERILLRA